MIPSIQTDEARHSQQSWDEKIDRKDSLLEDRRRLAALAWSIGAGTF
jgi:hypothetical protein